MDQRSAYRLVPLPWAQRSLRLVSRVLGLVRTGQSDYIWYAIRIRLQGLDLAGASVDELGLSPERAHMHANSGGPQLRRVLRGIGVPERSRIVDLGSGKGGALLTFSEFPFDEILGVELSESLVAIAQQNVKRLRLSNIQCVCADAGTFRDLDRFTHIYMFNPFPASVMAEVIDNVSASLSRRPRPLVLVMKHSESVDAIPATGLFRESCQFEFRGSHPFFCYVHNFTGNDQRRRAM